MPPDKSITRLCVKCEDKPQYWMTSVSLSQFRVGDYGSYISDYLRECQGEGTEQASVYRVEVSCAMAKGMAESVGMGVHGHYGMTNKYFVCVGKGDWPYNGKTLVFLYKHVDSDYLYTVVFKGVR